MRHFFGKVSIKYGPTSTRFRYAVFDINLKITLLLWQQQFFLFLQNDFDLREHKGSYLKLRRHGNELQFPLKVITCMLSIPC